MGLEVYVKPKEAWDFFAENIKRLADEQVAIAENNETDYFVYMTEDKGCPLLSVWRGEHSKMYEEPAVNRHDLEVTLKRIYLKYLTPLVVDSEKKFPINKEPEPPEDVRDPELELVIMQDEVYKREDDLQLATDDYLLELLCCKSYEQMIKEYGNFVDEFLERVCEILADEFSISVYRPKFEYDEETGIEEFVEFPYELPKEDNEEENDSSTETAQ